MNTKQKKKFVKKVIGDIVSDSGLLKEVKGILRDVCHEDWESLFYILMDTHDSSDSQGHVYGNILDRIKETYNIGKDEAVIYLGVATGYAVDIDFGDDDPALFLGSYYQGEYTEDKGANLDMFYEE